MYINIWFQALIKAFVGLFAAIFISNTLFAVNTYRWKFSHKTEELAKGEILVGIPETVSSSQDLSKLLGQLSERFDLIDLSAKRVGKNMVEIDGTKAKRIRSIQISGTVDDITSVMAREMRSRFLRLVYTSESDENILRSASDFLRNSGFPNASVSISSREVNHNLDIKLKIMIENPCVIDQVRVLPQAQGLVSSLLKLEGEVCQLNAIRERVRMAEQKLVSDGYLQAKLELLPLKYGPGLETAVIRVIATLGEKIIFLVEDESEILTFQSLVDEGGPQSVGAFSSSVEETESEIKRHFLKLGYEDVRVEGPHIIRVDEYTREYKFRVIRGPLYALKSVTFSGNSSFSQRTLWETLDYSTLLAFSTQKLDREDLLNRLEKVKKLYRETGYLDMKVASIRYAKDSNLGSVEAFVLINEGVQRKFQQQTVLGANYFSQKRLQQLLDIRKGQPLNLDKVLEYRDKLQSLYQDHGFLKVDVKVDLSHRRRLRWIDTDVKVSIREGPRTKIRNVDVLGLVKTSEEVVTRELLFNEGDYLSLVDLASTRRKLVDLGIFRSVQVSPHEIQTRTDFAAGEHYVDVVVELVEGDLGIVAFGPGYSLAKGFRYTSEFSLANFDGNARKITVRGGFSEERNQLKITDDASGHLKTLLGRNFSLSFLEPYLWGFPVDGKFSFLHKAVADNLWRISNRFQFSVFSKLDWICDGLTVEPNYTYKLRQDLGPQDLTNILVATGNGKIGSIGVKFVLDRRDEPSWPTEGFLAVVDENLARPYFGGEFSYLRNHFGGVGFYSLSNSLVLRNKAHFTIFTNIVREGDKLNSVLLDSERLSAIGGSGVRGFSEELGPYVELDNSEEGGATKKVMLRGNRRSLLTSELRWRLNDTWATHLFVDSGTTFLSDDELAKFDSFYTERGDGARVESNIGYSHAKLFSRPDYLVRKHYWGAGVGLSIITPIGPIELQLAVPISEPKSRQCQLETSSCYSRGSQDKKWYNNYQLYFNIGADQAS